VTDTPPGPPPRWGDQIGALSEERLSRLGQIERLGSDLGFVDALPPLRVIREVVTALSYQDPVWEPKELEGEVSQHLNELLRDVDLIEAFTPTENPAQRRQNIISSIDANRGWFLTRVAPLIRASDIAVATAAAEALAKRDEVRAAAEDAKAALASIRQAAGEKGTARLAQFFEEQAAGHRSTAARMLVSGAAAVVVLLLVGIAFVFVPELAIGATTDVVGYVRELIPRLFLLGIIAYAIRFFSRQYTVNKHLQVSNEQRANILRTFPAIVESGKNDVQRDRMAVVFAQAAVASIESGYLKAGEDKGLDSTALAILELLRR